jgi:hypothetical protein
MTPHRRRGGGGQRGRDRGDRAGWAVATAGRARRAARRAAVPAVAAVPATAGGQGQRAQRQQGAETAEGHDEFSSSSRGRAAHAARLRPWVRGGGQRCACPGLRGRAPAADQQKYARLAAAGNGRGRKKALCRLFSREALRAAAGRRAGAAGKGRAKSRTWAAGGAATAPSLAASAVCLKPVGQGTGAGAVWPAPAVQPQGLNGTAPEGARGAGAAGTRPPGGTPAVPPGGQHGAGATGRLWQQVQPVDAAATARASPIPSNRSRMTRFLHRTGAGRAARFRPERNLPHSVKPRPRGRSYLPR